MRPPLTQRRDGFTLKELMCAVAVGTVAIVLLLALVQSSDNCSGRSRALHTVKSIVVAVNAFNLEYGRFPALSTTASASSGDQWVGDPAIGATDHNSDLFFTLRALPKGANQGHKENAQRVPYFDSLTAQYHGGVARNGLFDFPSSDSPDGPVEGALYDPWGREYGIMIDTSGNGCIDLGPVYAGLSGAKSPRRMTVAFSCGRDGSLGKKGNHLYGSGMKVSDDIISWQ